MSSTRTQMRVKPKKKAKRLETELKRKGGKIARVPRDCDTREHSKRVLPLRGNLPWEYLELMNILSSDLEIFLQNIEKIPLLKNTDEGCKYIEKLQDSFFRNTNSFTEMLKSCTYQVIPLPDLPVSSKILRNTKDSVLNESNQLHKIFKCDINGFITLLKSLGEQFDIFTKQDQQSVNEMLKRAGYLFNFKYPQYPRIDVSVDQAAEGFSKDKGFSGKTFFHYADAFPFNRRECDQQTLGFQFRQLCDWFNKQIGKNQITPVVKKL